MVDKTLILRKLAELEEYLGQISEFSSVSADRRDLTPEASISH